MFRRLDALRRELPKRPWDLWDLLRTRAGRDRLWNAASWLAWPVLGTLASVRRRTVLGRTKVVAIVGSYGKTTTTRAVARALGVEEPSGTKNSWSRLALKVLRHRAGHPLVIEVGISRPGQMRAYARMLRPDIVVVTSIGGEHRRSFTGSETVQGEKAEMIRGLAPAGVAVLHGDDPLAAAMAPVAPGRVVCCGLRENNDVRAEQVRLDWPRGTEFLLVGFGYRLEARVGLVGRHSLGAGLAAAAVAHELRVPPEVVVQRLAGLAPTPGRMQPVLLPSNVALLRDDYKSGLETIDAALRALAEIPALRRIAALGDVTEPECPQRQVYTNLGGRVAHASTRIFYVGNQFESLASGARKAGLARDAVTDHADVHALAAALGSELREGDVVLLKGRTDQKLERVALILSGRTVRCAIRSCHVRSFPCESCALLETGWGKRRQIT